MAGVTLRVDIERAGGPARRGLPTVTPGAGAGAAVAAGRAAVLALKLDEMFTSAVPL